MAPPAVDLLVNCYERTYRDLLTPGAMHRIADEQRCAFELRTVVINNVDDPRDARERADALLEAGEIDRVVWVADRLDEALARTGLTRRELEPIPYFTDWALVAVTLDGPDWMLHWDPEIRLVEPANWVEPAIELMDDDHRILVANPNWPHPGDAEAHEIERRGRWSLGHGFSDHAFLARRSELARPIYRTRSLARLRYPVAHIGDIFEARLDAHIRRHGRLRATHLDVVYEHPLEIGAAYPGRTLLQKARYVRNQAVTRVLRASPWRPRSLRWMG